MEVVIERLALVEPQELLAAALGAATVTALVRLLPLFASRAPRALITSLTSLGFWIALASPSGATPRSADHPVRPSDAPEAPWSPAEGPPPLPTAGAEDLSSVTEFGNVRADVPAAHSQGQAAAPPHPVVQAGRRGVAPPHPAIHGGGGKSSGPLFPRVGKTPSDCSVDPELAECMKRHPAGRGLEKKTSGSTAKPSRPLTAAARTTASGAAPVIQLPEMASRERQQGSSGTLRNKDGESETVSAGGRSYVVQRGDSLWTIAEDLLGTDNTAKVARYWPAIHRANREAIGRDPNFLLPGQVLQLPDPAQF